MTASLGAIVSLFKLRIGLAITLSALGGLVLMPAPLPEWPAVLALAVAVFLASAAAGAFNQYAEAGLDARMARTRGRPFVTGALTRGPMWLAIIAAVLAAGVGLAAAVLNGWAALYVFMGAFVYGIVYTVWLKRRSWTNIVVGGLAGTFAVLAGAAAVDPAMAPAPLVLAVVLFLWTPPHFWSLATALKEDYAGAGVPMLPVVVGERACARVIFGHTVALSVLALVPAVLGAGWIYLLGALAGGGWFTFESARLVRRPTRGQAMRTFFASLGQLASLLVAAFVDRWLLGAPL